METTIWFLRFCRPEAVEGFEEGVQGPRDDPSVLVVATLLGPWLLLSIGGLSRYVYIYMLEMQVGIYISIGRSR